MAALHLSMDQKEETIKSPFDFTDRTLALGDVGMDENPLHMGVHGFQHKIFSGTGWCDMWDRLMQDEDRDIE